MTLGRKHYVTYFAPRFRNNQCEISGVNEISGVKNQWGQRFTL
jgi:hypothetical protein